MQVTTMNTLEPKPVLSSEKEALYLPAEMSAFTIDHTTYYYTGGLDLPGSYYCMILCIIVINNFMMYVTQAHARTHTHARTRTHANTHACKHARTHAHARMHTRTHTTRSARTHTTRAHTHHAHACAHAHTTRTHTHARIANIHAFFRFL